MHILLSSLVFLLICAFVQLEVQINLVPMRRLTPNTPDTFFRVSQRKGVLILGGIFFVPVSLFCYIPFSLPIPQETQLKVNGERREPHSTCQISYSRTIHITKKISEFTTR